MGRPFNPQTLAALAEYDLKFPSGDPREGCYVYSLREIADRYGLSVPALSRAAHKHGLSRYQTNR